MSRDRVADTVRALAEPLAAEQDASVYDVVMSGGKLLVSVTRTGGIDLDTLTAISRGLSERLDAEDVIGGSYTLEVSSPGLERTLRTRDHYAGAVGDEVAVRLRPGVDGDRRVKGVLRSAGPESITVRDESGEERTVALADVERARTVFTWGSADKPSGKKSPTKKSGKKSPGKKPAGKKPTGREPSGTKKQSAKKNRTGAEPRPGTSKEARS